MKKTLLSLLALIPGIGLGQTTISGLTDIGSAWATGDLMVLVDISATPPATGTTKKGTAGSLWTWYQTQSATFSSSFTISGTNGIDIGSTDADHDLLTVGATGTPTFGWNEAQDQFTMNSGLILSGSGDTLTLPTSGSVVLAAQGVLSEDGVGGITLSNIDTLDATTEATVEDAVDTLANLTSAAALATVGTITSGVWNAGAVTSSGTVEGATITEGGVAVPNVGEAAAISGVWEVQDDINFNFGNDADWNQFYDATAANLEFSTTATAATAITTGMFQIRVNDGAGTLTANQEVFEVVDNTTQLFHVDAEGDVVAAGDISVTNTNTDRLDHNEQASISNPDATKGSIYLDSDDNTFKFIIADEGNTLQTITSDQDNLSVFAATTSAQLAGVLSDETGTGVAVLATNPVLTGPEYTETALTGTSWAINFNNGSYWYTADGFNLAQAITADFTAPTGGEAATVQIHLRNGATGASTITWGSGETINWLGGTPAAQPVSEDWIYTISYINGVYTGVASPQTAQTTYEYAYVNAGAMVPRTTNGPAATTTAITTSGDDNMVDSLEYDTTTEEGAGFWITFPKGWDAGTVKFKFHWTTIAGAAGGVTWGVAGQSFADNDTIDVTLPASVDTDDTWIADEDMHITAASTAVTVTGAADEEPVYFEITRVVGDANDTMAADAGLLGVTIEYQMTMQTTGW